MVKSTIRDNVKCKFFPSKSVFGIIMRIRDVLLDVHDFGTRTFWECHPSCALHGGGGWRGCSSGAVPCVLLRLPSAVLTGSVDHGSVCDCYVIVLRTTSGRISHCSDQRRCVDDRNDFHSYVQCGRRYRSLTVRVMKNKLKNVLRLELLCVFIILYWSIKNRTRIPFVVAKRWKAVEKIATRCVEETVFFLTL